MFEPYMPLNPNEIPTTELCRKRHVEFEEISCRTEFSHYEWTHAKNKKEIADQIKSHIIEKLASAIFENMTFSEELDPMSNRMFVYGSIMVGKKGQTPPVVTMNDYKTKFPHLYDDERSRMAREIMNGGMIDPKYAAELLKPPKPSKPKIEGPDWYVELATKSGE